MSRKRKQHEAVPEEIIAEGSGPHAAEELAAAAEGLVEPSEVTEIAAEVDVALGEPAGSGDDQVASDAELAAAQDEAGELAVPGLGLPTSAASMDAVQLRDLVEALIFASDKPVTLARLRQLTRVSDVRRLEAALAELSVTYAERGISLQTVSGGYQFRTNTRFSAWVQQLIAGRPVRLSRAQLETLAIIAYRQPITRPEIDEIRGVDSSGTLKVLIERSLIRILGKKEEVGRPMLYGTTKEFLDFFSLSDLRELPTLREYSELTAESRQVMSDRLGIDPDAEPAAIEPEPADAATDTGEPAATEVPFEATADLPVAPAVDVPLEPAIEAGESIDAGEAIAHESDEAFESGETGESGDPADAE